MKTTTTPASATALFATLLLTHLAAAAPAPAPVADTSSPPAPPAYQYTDPNAVDWKEPQGWAPPAHFDWSVLAKSRAANPKYGDDGGAGYRRYKRKAGGGGGAGYGDEGHDDEGHDDGGYEGDESDDDDGGAAGVCSGNSNVASCCAGGACSVLPGPVLSGLLNVGGIGALTSSGCQAQQQVSCCPQNGGGLLNVQSCGPLIDIL